MEPRQIQGRENYKKSKGSVFFSPDRLNMTLLEEETKECPFWNTLDMVEGCSTDHSQTPKTCLL